MLVSIANRIQVLFVVSALLATAGFPGTAKAVDLYTQNFESVTLGPIVSYSVMLRDREAWTATPPSGMVVDNSAMPPSVMSDPNNGVTEFEGWTFVDKGWWNAAAGDQGRSGFFNGLGKIAVADNDTHDDLGDPDAVGPFDSKLSTPTIALGGAAANTVNLRFNSSWVPEEIQKATVTARYNTGANIEVLRWTSPAADPNFHASAVNETVTIPLQNPAGATSVILDFRNFDATNNWWWGIDNISVYTGAAAGDGGVLRAIVDRGNSNVKIVNSTGATVSLRGYSIVSAAGAFNEPNAAFLADSDPNWVQLTAANATGDLSEGHLSSSNLANNGTINLGNNVWRKYFQDASDVSFQYLVAGNDDPISGIVEFVTNGLPGSSFPFIDLNFNNTVDPGDWDTFRAGFPVSLVGKSTVQRYQLGDLDNDGLHTPTDFLRFRTEYDAAVGAGGFAAMLAGEVPEPGTGLLFLTTSLAAGVWMRRQRQRFVNAMSAAGLAAVLGLSATNAQAQLTLFSANFDTTEVVTLGPSVEEANAAPNVWTDTPPAGWTKDDSGVPGVNNPDLPAGTPDNNGMLEWAGWAFTNKTWWSTQVDGQGREQFNRGSGTVMVADPDEWDDEAHPGKTATTAECSAGGDTVNPCMYDAFITTRPITIPSGIPLDKIRVAFDSSWDDEGADDRADLANNQQATIVIDYNDRAPFNIHTWDSVPNPSPNYHGTAYNEAVEIVGETVDYNGTSTSMTLTFGLGFAENDWWWAVDNIRVFVPANESILRIDTQTGFASIVGGDVISTPINFIDIGSNNNVLNGAGLSGLSVRKPDSVDGDDAGSTVGDTSGEFWQQLAATDGRVAEAFLLGSSTFNNTRTEYLGTIFDTTTPVGMRDVTFKYTTTFGDIVDGIVQYCTGCSPAGVTGDYNDDGKVDAADYVSWRKFLNQSVTLPNDSTPGTVTPGDYTAWRQNFGRTASGAGSSTTVPEPGSGLLAIFTGLFGMLAAARRRTGGAPWWLGRVQMASIRLAAAFVVSAWCAASASAALPPPPVLDRDYDMGEAEGGVAGNNVSITFDDVGLPGMQQLVDLTASGGPKYEALPIVGGGPVPLRPDGGTGMAIRLNPTAPSQGQHLKTGFERALNYPALSWSSTGQATPPGTINYSNIRDRGFQLWVLPSALPTGTNQAHIVMDTNQHGALITSGGNFAMRYINTDYDTGMAVTPNTWYHLMVVRPFGSGRGSIMYVNGVAKAQASGVYRGEDSSANEETTPLVVGANTGTGITAGLQSRYQGLVDDLEMFVMGINNAADYGDFVFERDNKYAAFFKPSNLADLTGNNVVDTADVNIFVSNWLYQKVVGNQVIGDLETRMKGDFNYDGYVNLADWEILNELAPPGAGRAAWNMIHGIPEPGTLGLAALSALVGMARWRPRRRRA